MPRLWVQVEYAEQYGTVLSLSLPPSLREGRGRAGISQLLPSFKLFFSSFAFIPLKTTGGAAVAAARTLQTPRTSRFRSSSRGCFTVLPPSVK